MVVELVADGLVTAPGTPYGFVVVAEVVAALAACCFLKAAYSGLIVAHDVIRARDAIVALATIVLCIV